MKIIKFFGRCLLAFLLLFVIFWMIILATLQTKSGQQWTFTQVKDYLERATQTQIQIKDFHFSFPLKLSLEDIVIWKNNHRVLTIQDLELSCTYSKLLQGRIIFSKLQASGVDIFHLPHDLDTSSNKDSLSWEAPILPVYVKFENINIQRIKFDPLILNLLHLPQEISQMVQQSPLNLQGMISNNPFKAALTAHLLITAKSNQTDLSPFSVGIDTQNHQLSLSFHFNHLPLHILDPILLPAHLALYASAPVSTWQSLIENPSQEEWPIEGHLKLTLQPPMEDSTLLSTLVGQQTIVRSRYLVKSKREIELIDLKVDNSNISLQGRAIINDFGEIHQGHFQGAINHLNSFQDWLGKDIQGQIGIEGDISGSLKNPSFVLHLGSSHLQIAQQQFHNIQTTLQASPRSKALNGFLTLSFDHQNTPWKFASSFDWNDQKCLTLSHLQIDAMHSHIEGEISCSASDFIWEGFLQAHIGNLNDITHFLHSPISGEGQLKVQLAAVIDANHQKRQGLHAEFKGRALRWIDMNWQAQQLALNLHLDPLKEGIDCFQCQASLEGQEIQWKDYFVGRCTMHSSQIIDMRQLNLSHVSAEWKAQHIQWEAGKAAEAAGKVYLRQPLKSIEFAIHDIETSAIHLHELMGSTTLHPSQLHWPFQIKGRGFWKEDLLFDVVGNWHYQGESLEVEAQRLSGRFGPYPLQLKQPVHFLQHANDFNLVGLWLQWGEAEMQAEFHCDPQKVASNFKTNAVPSELFHFIAPDLPLAGRTSFQGYLEGDFHQPKGQLQIHLHNIQITEDIFAQKPFINGILLLDLNKEGMQLKSDLNGIGHTPLLISGHLPFKLSLDPLNFKIDPHLPFDLALNAEGELDPYLQLLYNDTTNLSGHAKIALRLDGQMHAPQIRGTIDVINGAYESLSTGALYHNIQAHLEGNGSKIILRKFSAQDNKSGFITATGAVNLNKEKLFPFEFYIHPAHIFMLDSDYAAISASGPLTLIGNMKKSKLKGELTVDQATIRLEEALPHQIKTIDIKYINVAQGEHLPNYLEKNETASTVELDVKLNAPQNVHIQSQNLKSEWKGSIAVTGTPDNPQLHGDLRIAQGEYNFNGKIFNLSQGNIHFAGAPDKKTSLYVVASKDIDRITAEIIVKGPVTKPAISFRSNPPLSQREVLSYILFNRGISDITPGQGDQLSQSFISLNASEQTKSTDDFNFLSRLRNNIGLDRLDFITNNNNENNDFALQVGKHITEDIMISINQSMISLSPVIAVEAKLRKNLKAQAEAGVVEDAPIRMSIKWKKDY
jgi:translocation and assembly module TamB